MNTNDIKYDPSHWALSHPCFIVHTKDEEDRVTHTYLNPTDKRCWRLIVRSVMKDAKGELDFAGSLNLMPNNKVFVDLLKSCMMGACDIAQRLVPFGLVGQIEFAGNNAMSTDTDNPNIMKLGSTKEPWFPHVHVIFRASINTNFLGIPYRGPPPGDLFDMRNGKIAWSESEKEHFHAELSKLLAK